jgi:hypothetical protein
LHPKNSPKIDTFGMKRERESERENAMNDDEIVKA